jgi:hypothetical protein
MVIHSQQHQSLFRFSPSYLPFLFLPFILLLLPSHSLPRPTPPPVRYLP